MAVLDFENATNPVPALPRFPRGAQAITPSADTYSEGFTVYVGGAGNVRVLPANGGAAVTFVGLGPGQVVPCEVIGVVVTGTTATSLVAIF